MKHRTSDRHRKLMNRGAKIIRILLVDDHPLVRIGLLTELRKNKDFEIAGEATNGNEAIQKAIELKPDVILLDITMPDLTGLEVIPVLLENNPVVCVIALTMHENIHYMKEVQRLGARGFLLKDSAPDELVEAIYSVLETGRFFYSYKKFVLQTKNFVNHHKLSSREIEVLKHISSGMTNKQIADKLYISKRTVEAHRDKIKSKLNLQNTAQLTKYALSAGIVD